MMTEPGSAPATPAVDPALFTGPGVTANPDGPSVIDAAALSQQNAQLRAELAAENDRLRAALEQSRTSSTVVQGLTDQDVRRLEHPEEFLADENAQLAAQVDRLQNAYAQLGTTTAATASTSTSGSSVADFTDNGDGTWTRSDGTRGTFGPSGFQPTGTADHSGTPTGASTSGSTTV